MYYHRALDDEFFNLLKEGGPLRPLVDLTREKWQGRDVYLDLQFRGDTISFYAGLTTLLQIRRDKKGNLRPRAAAAYRLQEHGVRALYRPGDFSDLVCHARQYLERVEVGKRYLSGEGLCQNWLSHRYGQRRRTGCGEPVAIDREVVVGYTDTAEQDLMWTEPIRREALGLLEQISKANPGLYGRDLHKRPLGDELDLLMWEPPGTFVLAEVKGRRNAHGIYMAPIQVTAYTMVWKRYVEPKSLADLERLVEQKRELGLIAMDDAEWESFKASLRSPEFVPALVVEKPNRASSCWKRLGEVIEHTAEHWPAGWGTPFIDSLRVYMACNSEDGWTDVTDDFLEWGSRLRITIHGGAHEIGGSCVELVSAGDSRILLDLGMPLARPDGSEWPEGTALRPSNELRAEGLLPDIRGLYAGDHPSVEGLVLSHSHIDHYGLAHHIHPEMPAFGSPGTLAILRASQVFLPGTAIPTILRELTAGSPIKIGDFMVTAIPVDHSAPASCAILVEADGQTILYSGDLRAHGPHPSLFAGLSESCTSPDALILEGTMVGQPAGAHGYSSESEVQSELTALFAEHAGLVALAASGQNVDRLVSIYRACLATGRQLVIDPYQAYILHVLAPVFGDLPRFDSPSVRVRFVQSQVETLKAARRFDLACEMARAAKVIREQLYSEPGAYALLARSNRATLDLLSGLPHPEEVGVVWSMWRGYWDKANPLKTFCATHGIAPHFIHSGGHAHPEDLRRLVDALRPRVVVPIHTQNAAQYSEEFPSVALLDDGLQVELTDLPQHIQAHSKKEWQTGSARVVVLSDCHGYPQTIRDALDHFAGKYGPFVDGTDRLVFAGDFLDRGPDPDGCLEALQEHDAVMVVGNHDQAVGLGYWIVDQDEDSRRFEPWISERLASGRMRLVTVEQGVLISHAGVSSQYQADLDEVCHKDLELFARRLCEEYVEAVIDQLDHGKRTPLPRILDNFAPHRYPTHRGRPGPQRPEDPNTPLPLLTHQLQIVGHRSPESTREALRYRGAGIYQIALPYGALDAGYFRYAVIEGGIVSVESNWPAPQSPDGRHSEPHHVVQRSSASPGSHRTASKGRTRAMSSRSDLEDLFPTLEDDGTPSDLPPDLAKRAQGCLLGQLAGDSLGSLVEFESEDSIRWQYPEGVSRLADGGTWGTLAGQPTDDSELALMLARSIIRHGGFDAAEAAVAYARWCGSSPFDCGNTTAQALRPAHTALVGGDGAEGVAATAKSRANGESQANGALMRVSPLGIFAHGLSADVCADLARQDALITHPHEVCKDANAVFVVAIAHAISTGAGATETYEFVKEWARGAVGETVRRCLEASAESTPADFQDHQGWVLIALQNAFWQLLHAPSLEQGVCDTVMRGGDTDTNAAIAGALLGAVHGLDAIPEQWRQAVLSCRPEQGRPEVRRPRPRPLWPVDALLVARTLAELGSVGQ